MKLYYLILAHKYPDQLARLINSLAAPHVTFYIHVDAGVKIHPFIKAIKKIHNTQINFATKREKCTWGHISIVRATIRLINCLLESAPKPGRVILLSGQHYPIKSNEFIYSFFRRNKKSIFIEGSAIPRSKWSGNGGCDRLRSYFLFCYQFPRKYIQLEPVLSLSDFTSINSRMKMLLSILLFPVVTRKRVFPEYLNPYGGSQWWSLPLSALKVAFDFIKENPDYLKYHQFSFAPDEIFFHSIFFSFNHQRVRAFTSLSVNNLLFEDWETHNHNRPAILTKEHFSALRDSDKLFARKFDEKVDNKILDLIDSIR